MFHPEGDPAHHLSLAELERGFAALPAAPRGAGTLRLITCRHPEGRLTPERARVTAEHGLDGDRWAPGGEKGTLNQLTLMQADVGALIANGQALSLFGDNLLVELDLSAEALPPGSRLRVGEVELEITPEPHTGCALYRQRFGADALRFISAKERRSLHLRGVHARVIQGGELGVGDVIHVSHRAGRDQ